MPLNFLNNGIFPDNAQLSFGTDGDLVIKHDGSNSKLENNTGHLYLIQEANDKDIIFQGDDSSGGVTDYYRIDGANHANRFYKNLALTDSTAVYWGNSNDFYIKHNATNTEVINSTGDLIIANYADDKRIRFQCDDGSGGIATYFDMQGGQAGSYLFTQWYDNSLISLGNGYDLQMWHDGTNTKFYNQTGDLKIGVTGAVAIQNNSWDENIATFTKDGSVDLFYDNSKKFETTASGIAITGGLTTSASSTMNAQLAINSTATDILTLDGRASGSYSSSQINFKAGDSAGSWNAYKITYVKTATVDQLQLIDGGGTAHVVFNNGGDVEFLDYGSGTFTGTATYFLTVDSSGNIIENAFSSAGLPGGPYLPLAGGTMTGDVTFNDNVDIKLGTGNDCTIFHDGTDTWIDNGTGNLNIRNQQDDGNINFICDDGSGGVETYFHVSGSTEQTLFLKDTEHQDSVKAQFGNQGDMKMYHDGTNSYIENITGDLYIMQRTDDGDLVLQCDDGSGGDTTYLRLDGSAKRIDIPDSIPLCFGAGDDLQIQHNGSTSYIQNFTGDLQIQNNTDDGDILLRCDDGSGGLATYMYLDGGNTRVQFNKDARFVDDKKVMLGTSDDLQIYHNATNSYISNSTGDLYIEQLKDDGDIYFKSDDGSGGTATYFFLDGSETRTTFNKEARFIDNAKLKLGTSGDLEIFHDGSDSYLENYTGTFYFTQHVNDGNMAFKCDNGSGGTAIYFTLDGGSAATDEYYTKWKDNSRIALGDGKDLQIYHDGSNSYIDETGTGSLYIKSAGAIRLQSDTGENMIYAVNDGAVNLYHNNVKTFETTASGIEVTGLTDTDSLLIGTSTTVTAILDEDNMASDSATALATQQSIKAYVDNSTTGVLTYQGTWNADTNSPTLSSGSGTPGYYYIVSVAGSTDLDGITDWAAGDWAVFSDLATDAWQKIDNTAVGNVSGSGANNRLVLWSGTTTVDSDSSFYMSGTTLYAPNLNLYGTLTATSAFTIDAAGQLNLDSGNSEIHLKGSGTTFGKLFVSGSDFYINNPNDNEDIIFSGLDDSSSVTALTLDMSDAGFATFNSGITAGAGVYIPDYIYHVGDTNTYFGFSGADTYTIVTGNTTALTIDSSQAATFAGDLQAAGVYIGATNTSYDLYNNGNSYFNGNVFVNSTLKVDSSGGIVVSYDGSDNPIGIDIHNTGSATGDDAKITFETQGQYDYIIGIDRSAAEFKISRSDAFGTNDVISLDSSSNVSLNGGALSISGDGSNAVTLTESGSGDFTIDAPDDIRLDAGGGDIVLRDDGTEYGRLSNNSGSGIIFKSSATNTSVYIQPNGTGNVYCETDTLIVTAADTEPAKFLLRADAGDDNGDDWYMTNPTTNILEFTNNISGSQVEHFSITPNATVADSIATFAGKVQIPSGYVGRDDHNAIFFSTDDQIIIRVADTHRLKLTSAGLLPYADSSYDLGSTTYRYSNIWVDNINGGTPTTGGPYLPLSGGTVSGNVAVTGTTTVGSSTGNGAVLHGSKAVTLTENTFTTTLTVTLSSNTACYVKIFVTGDWNSHSAVQYLGEYFLANSDGSYNEPGMIIREVDNTNTDSIVGKIVDPSGTSGNRDFVIQLKADDTVGSNNVAAKVTYEVMGQYVSVS